MRKEKENKLQSTDYLYPIPLQRPSELFILNFVVR